MFHDRPHADGHYYFVFNTEENICTVIGVGNVDMKISKTAITTLKDDPSLTPNMFILVDLRDIYFHPSYDEILAIKDHLAILKENYNNRMAVVINDELYYIGLLMSKLVKAIGLNMGIFKSVKKAKDWLYVKSSQKANN